MRGAVEQRFGCAAAQQIFQEHSALVKHDPSLIAEDGAQVVIINTIFIRTFQNLSGVYCGGIYSTAFLSFFI